MWPAVCESKTFYSDSALEDGLICCIFVIRVALPKGLQYTVRGPLNWSESGRIISQASDVLSKVDPQLVDLKAKIRRKSLFLHM